MENRHGRHSSSVSSRIRTVDMTDECRCLVLIDTAIRETVQCNTLLRLSQPNSQEAAYKQLDIDVAVEHAVDNIASSESKYTSSQRCALDWGFGPR